MMVIIIAMLFKIFHKVKESYGEHITLTLGVATWMLSSADCVMVVIICAK
jgi:hypothetical protein